MAGVVVIGISVPLDKALADGTGLLDPSEQRALEGEPPPEPSSYEGPLATRSALTGDWGGLRPRLEDQGVAFEFVYTGDLMANVSGGVHRRAEYLYNFDLTMTIDADKLLGWKGASFFVYGLGDGGTGSVSENVGDLQGVDNIEAPQTWKLFEAWWQQQLLDDRFSFLAGLYNLNGEFDLLDTASVFLNSSFGIGKDYSQCPTLGGWNPSPLGEAFRRLAVRCAGWGRTAALRTRSTRCTTTSFSPRSTASRLCGGRSRWSCGT